MSISSICNSRQTSDEKREKSCLKLFFIVDTLITEMSAADTWQQFLASVTRRRGWKHQEAIMIKHEIKSNSSSDTRTLCFTLIKRVKRRKLIYLRKGVENSGSMQCRHQTNYEAIKRFSWKFNFRCWKHFSKRQEKGKRKSRLFP